LAERANTAMANLGPGVYEVVSNLRSTRPSKRVGFNCGKDRWAKSASLKDIDDIKSEDIPGPGSYQQPTLDQSVRNKLEVKNGVFGTTERRFVNIENLKVPGPGEYDPTFP